MPAQLDDPATPQHFRRSGLEPYPTSGSALPADLVPRQVTLRDRASQATVLPFNSPTQLPASLISYLCDQLAKEIEKGDTYPMLDPMPLEAFGQYWFGVFGAVMIAAELDTAIAMVNGTHQPEPDWSKICLGSFYTKPNYPGRSSHVCNAGFLVTDAARNKGIGKLLGEAYLDWAPKLGYTYSVFNLVYETNVASCRIWDSLGFKRIGRVPKCGNLKSFPDQFIDAIIYGRELGVEGEEDNMTEERFDKIRYYLTHQTYPPNSTRAEKSRLRSAATHYRLLPSLDLSNTEPRLMLKDKEVIADPEKQYEIARNVHARSHAGINKTTAQIAERYHWIRIKETVSVVIRECAECGTKDSGTKASSGSSATAMNASRGAAAMATSKSQTSSTRDTIAPQQILQAPRTLSTTSPFTAGDYPVDPQLISAAPAPNEMLSPSIHHSPSLYHHSLLQHDLSPEENHSHHKSNPVRFQSSHLRQSQEGDQPSYDTVNAYSLSGTNFAPDLDPDPDSRMEDGDGAANALNVPAGGTADVLTSEDLARLTRAAKGEQDGGSGGWG